MLVQFDIIWRKFIEQLDNQGIDSGKHAGARNSFGVKVRHLIVKKKSNVIYYHPNERLFRIWKENEIPQVIPEELAFMT
jgi:hypothetical protein